MDFGIIPLNHYYGSVTLPWFLGGGFVAGGRNSPAFGNDRDHALGARVASWTRQPVIHTTHHTTRSTTTPPTRQSAAPAREPRLAASEWLSGPDNQRSTPPTTPLAQPQHHRPTSAAICSGPLGDHVSQRLRDHGLGARVASWTRQSAIHTTHHTTRAITTPPTNVGVDLQCPLGNRVSHSAFA